MSQSLNLKIAGLWTLENELSSVPEGALAIASNISIAKDNIAESRRGFKSLFNIPNSGGGSSQYADAFYQMNNQLIVHYGSSLGYFDGTNLNSFSGTFDHPSATTRMKFALANRNMYFTTEQGVYKLDALTNEPIPAGVPPALDTEVTLNATTGFLNTQSSVAYRVVWGYTDANQNLLLSAPSNRAVVNNPSAVNTSTTNVTFTIPTGITTSYLYQVYRSDQVAYTGSSPSVPDDNMQLVYEGNPTSGEISAGTITINDITPDSLRGAALYTNSTQQGILQQNSVPPFANDVCLFKNCLFFANVLTTQTLQINMLSVGGTTGVQVGDTITIGSNTFTAGNSQDPSTNTFLVDTSDSPAQNIDTTAQNLVACINQSSGNTTIYAYYVSTTTSLPGQILLQNRTLNASAFNVTASGHGTAWSPTLPTSGTSVQSTSQSNQNGLMYSKPQQPESVPSLNIFYVGSASYAIERIIPLRDSLFILKRDGIFRLTGTDPSNFSIDTIDPTCFITAPNTAVALGNNVYALTTQGVAQISDTGVVVISRPIEDQLQSIVGTVGSSLTLAFGISYEADRSYILFLPQTNGATSCSIAFVYNYFTKTWVTWNRNELTGFVLQNDNKLYLGNSTTSDVSQERKDFTYTDFSDESIPVSISSYSNGIVTLSSVAGINVGDILYQSTQNSSTILDINVPANQVTVSSSAISWTIGSAEVLQAIECTIQWLPNAAQNAGILKHFSEGTLIFKSNQFINNALINYYSDLDSSFSSIPFTGTSPLGWGFTLWGSGVWGGGAYSTVLRHYIPRNKQRCSLLTPQFNCRNAWGNFKLEGLSLQFNEVSSRGMR